MKLYKIILPVVASTMLLTGCKDQIMEWGTPEGHTSVTKSEIPLAVKEALANYDNIKTYSIENHSNMVIGLGIGKDIYMDDSTRHALAVNNFQMITWGNAMKHDAIVDNTGMMNFRPLDNALEALVNDGLKLYGHNFFWHTQQNQNYLKSLIAPEVIIETDGDIANVLKNSTFDKGIDNWMGWGNGSTREWDETGGIDGSGAAKINVPNSGNQWDVQFCQDLPAALEAGKTYILRFKVRTNGAGDVQCCVQQPSGSYPAVGYETKNITSSWYTFEKEIKFDDTQGNTYTRLCINTGKDVGVYWIDNIEFGEKIEGPVNYCENGSFENGTEGWTISNPGDGVEAVEMSDAPEGKHVLQMKASATSTNAWDLEVASPQMVTLPGKKVRMSFWIKSDQIGQGRVAFNGLKNNYPWMPWLDPAGGWSEAFETSTTWQHVNVDIFNYNDNDFAEDADHWTMKFDFGYMAGVTYYLDDVQVTEITDKDAATRRATKITYKFKTAEEKNQILTNSMETWVKGMAEHLANRGITPVGYDVINEAITDGECKIRGVDNVFGGSVTDDEGKVTYDSAPTENETEGLNLHWGNGHFYWGYYVKDYAVKAFQFARKYLPAETKLFYNDYNLENSDAKRKAAIDFVNGIDEANGSPIVDGIGTQMHITLSGTSDDEENNAAKIAELRAKIDKQFKELVDGTKNKFIRITELDISLGTSSPSAAQYKAQSDAYMAVFESYFENVPKDRQSGITIWSLTDAEDEHEYWLKGETPNLFDASYLRKWAYKGVCDALAGEDLGLKFGGEAYKAYYEKQNVSSTVE